MKILKLRWRRIFSRFWSQRPQRWLPWKCTIQDYMQEKLLKWVNLTDRSSRGSLDALLYAVRPYQSCAPPMWLSTAQISSWQDSSMGNFDSEILYALTQSKHQDFEFTPCTTILTSLFLGTRIALCSRGFPCLFKLAFLYPSRTSSNLELHPFKKWSCSSSPVIICCSIS